MDVVFLGAGVIGLATAGCVSGAGRRATLVERNQGLVIPPDGLRLEPSR
jgi:2-polyprenyl-6-methoxyphenol hydroxylase-like FAD-dependent oxidoreductase